MKRKELVKHITKLFKIYIEGNEKIFLAHDYSDDRYIKYVKDFKTMVKNVVDPRIKFIDNNMTGIGNNNRYKVVLEEEDKDGFIIQKIICYYNYTTGIYGGVVSWLEDVDGMQIIKSGRAV